ncbi:HalOD1 output domain-containing protein [Halobaculum limi]|uniref:HalOD1 output domain-containing protein n=1 Tax=Halobaculum limi TaxID=3031916 RepID=UPI002406AFC2|nr:HalOD1 output domain-containing protein [Halobaculum sp. YSMS11]
MNETTEPDRRRLKPLGTSLVHDTYDWSRTSPIEGVTRTIAAATGTSYVDLEPLHNVVHTDALTSLVEPDTNDPVNVTFQYEGYLVSVHSSGDVLLYHG